MRYRQEVETAPRKFQDACRNLYRSSFQFYRLSGFFHRLFRRFLAFFPPSRSISSTSFLSFSISFLFSLIGSRPSIRSWHRFFLQDTQPTSPFVHSSLSLASRPCYIFREKQTPRSLPDGRYRSLLSLKGR